MASVTLGLGCLLVFTGGPAQAEAGPHPPLEVRVFAAGHADATLLSVAGKHVLIDAGRGDVARLRDNLVQRRILPLLRARGIKRLAAFILTHPHWDHTGDPELLARHVRLERIYVNEDGRHWLGTQLEALAPLQVLARGDTIRFGALRLDTLWPKRRLGPARDHIMAINNRSLVLRMTHGRATMLLAGDLMRAGERALLRSRARLRADVLKLGHHGIGSSSPAWLRAVAPRWAIATCGQRWSGVIDGLSGALLRRLRARRIKLLRTDRHGDVLLRSDGKRWRVVPRASALGSDRRRADPGRRAALRPTLGQKRAKR